MAYSIGLGEHPLIGSDLPWGKSANIVDALFPLAERPFKYPSRLLADVELERGQGPVVCLDGALLLKRYFRQVPRPPKSNEILVLPSDFSSLTPQEWFRNTVFFDLMTEPRDLGSRAKSVLISGVFHPSVTSIANLSKAFSSLKSELARRFPKGRPIIEFMFIFRESPWLSEQPFDFANRIIEIFYQKLGPNVCPVNWSKVSNTSSFEGVLFADINDHLLCSSSALQFHVLSRGGVPLLPLDQMLKPRETAAELFYIPFSQFHGAGVRLDRQTAEPDVIRKFTSYWKRELPYLSLSPTRITTASRVFEKAVADSLYN